MQQKRGGSKGAKEKGEMDEAADTDSDEDITLSELAKAGKIVEFGLSNFPAWKVVDIWHKCAAKDMVRPTVFQGWCAAWFEIALPQLR